MELRLNKLRQILKEQSLDAVLISSVSNIYYVTGYGGFSIEERDAFVFITKDKGYVISSPLYSEAIKSDVPHMESIERTRTNSFEDIMHALMKKHTVKRCGFEENNLTVAEYNSIASLPTMYKPVDLDNLRVIKEKQELNLIHKACQLGDKAFAYIFPQIKSGITEKGLADLLEIFIKQHGGDPSFRPIVAFGKNAAIPHHFTSKKALTNNTCVLIDFGVKLDHYCSDMSRTVFFGKVSDEEKKVYQTVLEAQQEAIAFISGKLSRQEQIKIADIDIVAREYVVAQGYPPFNHASHGIGIEVHESPRFHPQYGDILQPGMVFSIEPGIYLPGHMGVRIEDDFMVKDNKLMQLTRADSRLLTI